MAVALAELSTAAAAVGLKLNASKCELITLAGEQAHVSAAFPQNFIKRPSGNFELLGGPVRDEDYCNTHTRERVVKACKLLTAIGELPDPQVALLLLRHCASFGKLVTQPE